VPPLPQAGMGFPNIPGATYTGLKTTRYLFNYGPNFYTTGIMTINPPVIDFVGGYQDNPRNGPIYPSFIPKTDADGNDIAGVRLPDVTVPVSTYTGWALRSGVWANDGCEGSGQLIPFPKTQAERMATGDPRLSVAERYPTFDAYYTKAVAAIDDLVKHRLVLCEDASSELVRMVTLGVNRGVPPPVPPATTPAPVTFRCETVPTPRCQDVRQAANAACQANASINNGSSDQDGDPVTLSQSPGGPFGLGTTQATLTATDPSGNFNSCSSAVTVVDQTAPSISSLSASPGSIWPANNKFVRVNLSVGASDNCDKAVQNSCRVVSVRVGEDDDDWCGQHRKHHGKYHRKHDHDDDGRDARVTGKLSVELRAEKDNDYQIRVECDDASGNSSSQRVTVEVAHKK